MQGLAFFTDHAISENRNVTAVSSNHRGEITFSSIVIIILYQCPRDVIKRVIDAHQLFTGTYATLIKTLSKIYFMTYLCW